MRRWPDVLPGASFPGYSLSPQDKTRRSDMEVGDPRVRQITRARRDMVSMSCVFSDAEMGVFRDWFDDLPVSYAGDSDDLTTWFPNDATISAASVTGPDDCSPSLLIPSAVEGYHSISRTLDGLWPDDFPVIATVTLASAGLTKARLVWVDRSGTAAWADLNLMTGAIIGTPGFPVTVLDRGAGFWRLTATLNTGTGLSSPILRIVALNDAGTNFFTGNAVDGLLACEVMVRQHSGPRSKLFLRSGANGRALGAAEGAGWFQARVPLGGGFSVQDCRFVGTFEARAGSNLEWNVSAKLEVRYA